MNEIILPAKWESIQPESITKTVHYLKEYCGHTDRDHNERWEFLGKRAEQRFVGEEHSICGGICGYKEYKRLMKYIAPHCIGIKYGYVGSAVCFIMHSINEKISDMTIEEIMASIKTYQDNWYNNKTIASGYAMWCNDGNYQPLLSRMKKAYSESNAAPQICTVLTVMYAMQWSDFRIQSIQSYLDNDDL